MKIFNLTYNELVKQFKKPSIKIMFLLILISAIILPIGISKIPQDKYLKQRLEANEYNLQLSQQTVDEYKNDKSQKGKVEYQYALIEKEESQLYVDNKIGYDDWRGKQIEILSNKSFELAPINFILQGIDREIISSKLRNVDTDKIESYYKLSKSKLKELKASLEEDIARCKKIIETNDYLGYIQEEIKVNEGFISEYEKEIEKYNKLRAKNPTSKEKKAELLALEKEAIHYKKVIEHRKQEIEVLQFRYDNKIDYNPNNWKNNSIKTVENEMTELRMEQKTEEDYYREAKAESYAMSYEEYVENYNKMFNKRVEKIKKIWYGLENNIPALNDITDSRSVLNSTYSIYIILSIIMVIVVAGGIVSSEFSKGTIRLLLIRPVSRWKILLSKFISVLVVGFSVAILGIGILYISTGMVYGFETYKTPILEVVNGVIVQKDFIKILLPQIVTSLSSLVFMSSLVFVMSTITKNTALSVAISMLIYLGAAPITNILVSAKQSWIMNTIIPYINAPYYRLVPTLSEVLENGFGMQIQYTQGAIQLLIVSLIILVLAFITFVKKDIKN